jgi:hypothetical protein
MLKRGQRSCNSLVPDVHLSQGTVRKSKRLGGLASEALKVLKVHRQECLCHESVLAFRGGVGFGFVVLAAAEEF